MPLHLVEIPRRYATRAGIRIQRQWLDDCIRICERFDLRVNSGYRTAQQNRDAGGASNSDHLRGDAADFTGSTADIRHGHDWADDRYPYVEPLGQSHDHLHVSFRHAGRAQNPPPGQHRVRPLAGRAFQRSLWRHAREHDLDPVALAAAAMQEGVSGRIGDHGTSYGPWQLHIGGALPRRWARLGRNSRKANAWAWSNAGIAYVCRLVAHIGGSGRHGPDAARWLIYHFERPREDLREAEAQNAADSYAAMTAYPGGPREFVHDYFHGPAGGAGGNGNGNGGDGNGGGPPENPNPGEVGRGWTRLIRGMSRDLPRSLRQIRSHTRHIQERQGRE